MSFAEVTCWSRFPLCLYDIDDLGAGVVFQAMKVHPQIWLSGLVLENPFHAPAA
ncbi:hypothetical protein [Nocardioides sp.]|uniref:hypothetical protein n=1 Tax=Nocardioides sp. TaxID=35761 RepID=UPI00262B0C47|nr:hypothetical protein [Nocardioides sp.]